MCGAVHYECSADPLAIGTCHCQDCQRATGTVFATAMVVPREAVTITGEVKYYDLNPDLPKFDQSPPPYAFAKQE